MFKTFFLFLGDGYLSPVTHLSFQLLGIITFLFVFLRVITHTHDTLKQYFKRRKREKYFVACN